MKQIIMFLHTLGLILSKEILNGGDGKKVMRSLSIIYLIKPSKYYAKTCYFVSLFFIKMVQKTVFHAFWMKIMYLVFHSFPFPFKDKLLKNYSAEIKSEVLFL